MNERIVNIINEEVVNLYENPEVLSVDGKTHYFRNPENETYAFSTYGGELLLSTKNGSHGDSILKNFNLNTSRQTDDEQFQEIYRRLHNKGRIWINLKTITFWDSSMPESYLRDIIGELKKYFPNENISKYKIEFNK